MKKLFMIALALVLSTAAVTTIGCGSSSTVTKSTKTT